MINTEKFKTKTMADFDDSFNMIVGTTNKDIDWSFNPYVSMNVYELD